MAAERARACLTLLGLLSGACAAFGYDFSDYQANGGSAGSAGAMDEKAAEPVVSLEPEGDGGANGVSSATGAGEAKSGAAGDEGGAVLTTFGAGGAPLDQPAEPRGEGGSDAGGARGEAGARSCEPELFACLDAGAQCGSVEDSCGRALDCGQCFWWFEQCQHNHCVILPNP
jgi:hypothetical protein